MIFQKCWDSNLVTWKKKLTIHKREVADNKDYRDSTRVVTRIIIGFGRLLMSKIDQELEASLTPDCK